MTPNPSSLFPLCFRLLLLGGNWRTQVQVEILCVHVNGLVLCMFPPVLVFSALFLFCSALTDSRFESITDEILELIRISKKSESV